MFSQNTHIKFGTIPQDAIEKLRGNNNRDFIIKQKTYHERCDSFYLIPEEELVIVRHYECVLIEFFKGFMPLGRILPNNVKETAFQFYKRFYLVSSVMDYHPKEMMFACIFLACKTCDSPVPINAFVRHINGDAVLLNYLILDHEMTLLHRLNFKLNIYTSHQAIENLMTELKNHSGFQRPERLNEHLNRFITTLWNTDVCLMYPPPFIALAALIHSVSRCNENIDKFVLQKVLNNPSQETLNGIISAVRKIRSTVMKMRPPPTNEKVAEVESKLSMCRNPVHDPTSDMFKRRMSITLGSSKSPSEQRKQ